MNVLASQDLLNRIIWIRGIPPVDFWIRREGMIGEFVQKNKLKPIDTAPFEIEAIAGAVEAREEKAALPLRRPPFPGGMRSPHLHFRGAVYALNEQQWRAFSGGVVKDLNERLAKASVLSFDQMRDVAEGIDKFA
ncbi:MAG: hypothetical protein J0M01_14840 [Dechloromonas sp.]|jgi:hypothetical protein|nr:hypothetical protein [Dechloromonas sp.]MBN8464066.1 hypothetical protein [Dechloromonas sp.]